MSFPEDLVAQLVAEGVGTPAVNIFVSNLTATGRLPQPHLLITETGGSGPINTQNILGDSYETPSAQILARGADYADVRLMSERAYNALVKVSNQSLNGTWYLDIQGLQKFIDLGLDENSQVRIAFNVLATKRP
jgi:hypothetical protein